MFEHWPLPVEFKSKTEFVCLSDLDKLEKRKAWDFIKNEKPQLAELINEISSVPALQDLIHMTGAKLCVEKSVFLSETGDVRDPSIGFVNQS